MLALSLATPLLAWSLSTGGDRAADVEARPLPPREEFLRVAERLKSSGALFFGLDGLRDLERRVGAPGLSSQDRIELGVHLCRELMNQGLIDRAVEEIESLARLIEGDPGLSRRYPGLHWLRGLVHLRKAEVENCIRRSGPRCCIFPLAGDGVHSERGPARAALRSFARYLEIYPQRVQATWLLNLAAMALGEYPDAVPEAHRIPPETFASEAETRPFVDVAAELGVDAFNLCGGVAVEDFDGDGALDIVTSTMDPEGSLRFYRGRRGEPFVDRTGEAGLDGQLGGLNCLAADHDDDGDMDVLVLRGAWLRDAGRIRNSLLENDGRGRFEDVTHRAGLALPARPTQAACFGDFDGDGALDLYVGNESRREIGPHPGDFPSQLFRNGGEGTFVDVARKAGVTNDRYAKGVAAGDFDNDGDLDLYVSNVGKNRLYRNEGDGTFRDVAGKLGVEEPVGRSFACWFFDYQNDGWLDLFVAAFEATLRDVASDALGLPNAGKPPRLYRNSRGRFEDVTAESGLDRVLLPMGANFGDLEHDGWLDLYLATGDPQFETLTPNAMLTNDAGERFLDVTTAGGFGHLQKGHGVAFADFEGDGDQDVYTQLGGFFPGDGFRNALFQNPGFGNRFVYLRLRGTESNANAIGARIRLVVEEEGGETREIHRAVGSTSSFGGSPHRQEIGLGRAEGIRTLEVRWPDRRGTQTFQDVPLDAAFEIVEGSSELLRVEP